MTKNIKNKKIIALVTVLFVLVAFTILKVASPGNFAKSGEQLSGEKTEGEKSSYEALFTKDSVLNVYVDIPDEDWQSILADPLAEEYKSATVKVNDVTLEDVGFRTKGNSTLRSVANSDSERYSFRIKLDKYVDDQNLLGLDEFVLNNMFADPSYMREYLSYEALREIGADVPLTTFANIYINGELYGFYLMVEAIDDSFLTRNFADNGGSLYKQEQGSTLQYAEGSSYERSELKSGDDETKTDLQNFIKVLNEMPEGQKGDIEKVLDVSSALKYIAANTVLGSYDSYNGNMSHNYYLYGEEGKLTVVPWDYNMSFGGFGGGEQTTIPLDQPVLGVNIKNQPLINNLLAVEEYKEEYYQYINELLGYLDNFEERVIELAGVIRPYIEADPTKFYTMEQFEANITYSEVDNTAENLSPAMTEGPQDGNRPASPQGLPEGFENDNRPEQPQNMPEEWEMGKKTDFPSEGMEGRPGGPRGGMGRMGNAISIINYVRERTENIQQQLAGELPTTGNTTMNNNMGRNPRGNS